MKFTSTELPELSEQSAPKPDPRTQRKLVPIERGEVMVLANTDTLIEDAKRVIEVELVKFRNKVNSGRSLELKEGSLLNGYIKSLVELAKVEELRSRGTDRDLSKLSDEELIKLIRGQNEPSNTKS